MRFFPNIKYKQKHDTSTKSCLFFPCLASYTLPCSCQVFPITRRAHDWASRCSQTVHHGDNGRQGLGKADPFMRMGKGHVAHETVIFGRPQPLAAQMFKHTGKECNRVGRGQCCPAPADIHRRGLEHQSVERWRGFDRRCERREIV